MERTGTASVTNAMKLIEAPQDGQTTGRTSQIRAMREAQSEEVRRPGAPSDEPATD